MSPAVVRPRWARVAGALWLVAGAALALAGLVVLADQQRLAWELAAGVVALVVGWWVHHRELVVDEHGVEQAVGFRRSRLQWSVVESVRLDSTAGAGAAVRLDLHGRGPVRLPTSQGLSRSQYVEVAEALRVACTAAGVPVTDAQASPQRR